MFTLAPMAAAATWSAWTICPSHPPYPPAPAPPPISPNPTAPTPADALPASVSSFPASIAAPLSLSPPTRRWTLKRDAEKNQQEAAAEREPVWYDKMDLDGYALM